MQVGNLQRITLHQALDLLFPEDGARATLAPVAELVVAAEALEGVFLFNLEGGGVGVPLVGGSANETGVAGHPCHQSPRDPRITGAPSLCLC